MEGLSGPHTIAVTPIALHSVAHTVSQQIPAISEVSRGCRATSPIPPKKRPCRTYLATSLSLCRGKSSLQKRIALHGGVAATLTPIALHCATKWRVSVPDLAGEEVCARECVCTCGFISISGAQTARFRNNTYDMKHRPAHLHLLPSRTFAGGSPSVDKKQKNNKLNLLWPKMARLDPLLTPKPPPFCVLSQTMRHMISFFGGGPKMGCFGRGPKSLRCKILCAFSVPP